MACIEKKLTIQQKYCSPSSMQIVRTWFQMGNVHQHMRSHPNEAIDCFIQGLNLYESIERPDDTQHMKETFNQMISLEMRRLNTFMFWN
jgi:hypothetical protein